MPEHLTPRQIVKQILQGDAPARPLLAPIVFSLGARVENLPLGAFMENPTKITSALRQIRPRLRSDGAVCYFDPLLEFDSLTAASRSPEAATQSVRAKTALEVIRRMAATRRDDSLLITAVSGPCTLAARLANLTATPHLAYGAIPADALNLAAATITHFATAFVEAGANLIFIQEDTLPALSPDSAAAWSSLLAPIINIVRFYEALPALQLTDPSAFRANRTAILAQSWDCVLCLPVEAIDSSLAAEISAANIRLGIALPHEAFQPQPASSVPSAAAPFHDIISGSGSALIGQFQPVLLTTSGDSSAAPANQIRSTPE